MVPPTDYDWRRMMQVTQADRDAAADCAAKSPYATERAIAQDFLSGALDEHRLVQAFARHRLLHMPMVGVESTRWEEMIRAEAQQIADKENGCSACCGSYGKETWQDYEAEVRTKNEEIGKAYAALHAHAAVAEIGLEL